MVGSWEWWWGLGSCSRTLYDRTPGAQSEWAEWQWRGSHLVNPDFGLLHGLGCSPLCSVYLLLQLLQHLASAELVALDKVDKPTL